MVINYKCPNCGAAVKFDEESGRLCCESCGCEMILKKREQSKKDKNQGEPEPAPEKEPGESPEETPLGEDSYICLEQEAEGELIQMQIYHCKNCGAELMTDEHTAATICNFCGSPGLISDRLSGVRQPDAIIPFRITKEQAIENFRKWVKGSILTPGEFTSRGNLEKITGLYVPYWLYSYHVNTAMRARGTRVRKVKQDNTRYIYTDHYSIYRDMDTEFEKVPVDASERMDDTLMESLEPYDYSELKPFNPAYLVGYQAEKFNSPSENLQSRAESRVKKVVLKMIQKTVDSDSYDTFDVTEERVQIREKQVTYAMLPVWVLNYRYKDQNYSFIMNGQTGKRRGRLPWSKALMIKWLGIIGAVSFALMSLIWGDFL